MKLKAYTKRKNDMSDTINNSIGKSIVVCSAPMFYEQLFTAISDDIDTRQRYDIIRNVFARVIEQGIMDCQIAFVGFFAKLD